MVSAPSVRKQRRESIKAERRQARGGRPAPIVYALIAIAIIGALILGAFGLRAWLTDPLARGRESLAAGDARAARIDLMAAATAAPDDAAIRLDLARAYNLLGRGEDAARQLDRAATLGMAEDRLRTERAQSALIGGDARAALTILNAGSVPNNDSVRALTIAADAQYRTGDYHAASASFQQALRLAPDNIPLWTSYARYRLAEQDMLGAETAANRLLNLAPQSASALAVKAEVVRTRFGPVASLPWYQAALDRQSDNPLILIEYAAALGDAGRYRDMLAPLHRAVGLEPGNPRVITVQAALAARGGEPLTARALLARLRGEDAEQPSVLMLKAAVELMLDSPVDAANYAQRLVTLQPDNRSARQMFALALMRRDNIRGTIEVLDPITTRPDADSWSLLLLSRAMAGLDWQKDSEQPLARASLLRPGTGTAIIGQRVDGDALEPGVVIPHIRARLAAGDGPGALALANQLAAINPGVQQAALLQGDAALVGNDVPAAIRYYRRAAALRFDEPVMLRLVAAQLRAGDRSGAAMTLRQFMARWPENTEAMRVAVSMLMEQSDWNAALAQLEALEDRVGPFDALVLSQLARVNLERGDAAAALPYAERAYRLIPANATISGLYGLALSRTGGNAADARDLLFKAVQLAPDDGVLRGWQREVQQPR